MAPAVPFYGYMFGAFHDFSIRAMPDMPQQAWWVAGLVLLVLGASALIDAFTSTVPDPLIFVGMLAVIALQGMYASWPFAAEHLIPALEAVLTLWAINYSWYLVFNHDAFGMGDAKWTMLAVACFGVMPAVYAWGIGAILGVIWLCGTKLLGYQNTRVYFAPFLFIGLLAGIYWTRLA